MKNLYDETYYERGVELGISGYSNYRWLPKLTIPMCQAIVAYLKIETHQKILDFGCAKGFTVKAFRQLGFNAFGIDISEYAIANADPEVRQFLTLSDHPTQVFDWVISKDVFEHIPYDAIDNVLMTLSQTCRQLFCVVPLGENGKFVVPEYEHDVTHVIRENRDWWLQKFELAGFAVNDTTFRVPGIKDNWAHYEFGNLFLTAKSKVL